MPSTDILLFIFALLFAIIGWFLRQKDLSQAEAIKLLFQKHDEDAAALQELRLQIAEGHYKKAELDMKFLALEKTFKDGFDNLGMKFDTLSQALMQHLIGEGKK